MIPSTADIKEVQQSLTWLYTLRDKLGAPIEDIPYDKHFQSNNKTYQGDLQDLALKISEMFVENRYEVGGIIAFGPERHDSILSVAERYLIPVVYVYPHIYSEEELQEEINKLPVYPYLTPFVQICASDIIVALSTAIQNFGYKESEE